MITTSSQYLRVNPRGVQITGDIMPLRSGFGLLNPRGEDIAFLLEAIRERTVSGTDRTDFIPDVMTDIELNDMLDACSYMFANDRRLSGYVDPDAEYEDIDGVDGDVFTMLSAADAYLTPDSQRTAYPAVVAADDILDMFSDVSRATCYMDLIPDLIRTGEWWMDNGTRVQTNPAPGISSWTYKIRRRGQTIEHYQHWWDSITIDTSNLPFGGLIGNGVSVLGGTLFYDLFNLTDASRPIRRTRSARFGPGLDISTAVTPLDALSYLYETSQVTEDNEYQVYINIVGYALDIEFPANFITEEET